MSRDEIIDALERLLPSQLNLLITRLDAPVERLSGDQTPQGTRISELVRWLEQKPQERWPRLQAMLGEGTKPATSAGPEVSIARLPATAARLFGREADLAWLDRCWSEGAHVVTVVAMGGAGKSALVNGWLGNVEREAWRGFERVYAWSFYSQGTSENKVASADEFIAVTLRWFGDRDPTAGSPWEKGERLASLVRAKKTLLVLDGLEPLQAGPGPAEGVIQDPSVKALIRELGAENKGLCVISTRVSVDDLKTYGERARELKLEQLSIEAGAALLRARGVRGRDEELREAAGEYKGHGLALTLLGSYLEEACDGDVARRGELGPLERDDRLGAHARHVMEGYERWFGAGPERAILRMVGLFDRPAGEDEIAALRKEPVIAGLTDGLSGVDGRKWNSAVARLRRAGLLAESKDKRLDAHPLVREHFGEQVRSTEPEAWREGHRRLYEHLKGKAKPLPETVEEMEPLYAAVIHGCRAGMAEEALDEVFWKRVYRENVKYNWSKLGAFGSEAAVLSAFFDPPWERLAPGLSDADQAWVLNNAGFVLRALGRLEEAAGLMRAALEMGIAQGRWASAAIRASNLSELLQTRGALAEAVAARQSVELADKSGDAFQRMASRTTLAAAHHALGARDEATALFQEAERMQKERQPEYPRLYSLWGYRYCDLLLDQGRDAEVRERAAQALKIVERNNWVLDIALDHLSLGRAHLLAAQRGSAADIAPATTHVDQAVDYLRRAGDQDMLPLGLLARADLHTFTGDFPRAQRDLDGALTLSTRCGFRLHACDAHLGHARFHLAQANPTAASAHLANARAILTETGYHRRDGDLERLEAMTRDQLLDALLKLSPSELETLITRLDVPAHHISSPPAPVATRAVEVFRYQEARNQVAALASAVTAALTPRPALDLPPAPALAEAPKPGARPGERPVDFLIFAPLEEERDALLSKLPGHRRLDGDGQDVHVYFEAEVATQRQDRATYRVLVTSPADMGPVQAAITAAAMTTRWQPAHVLVVGIAGGLSDEVALGDVLVASSVADYSLGKVEDGKEREERWSMIPADPALLNAAKAFKTFHDLITEARPEGSDQSKRHAGIIASGGDVVASRQVISTYKKDHPKLLGVEMEGAGVAAALFGSKLKPGFLMIRGVSDLADAEGNKEMKARWRAYARDVAAAYAVGFLRQGPVPGR